MTTATASRVSREILEDRYDGLMAVIDDDDPGGVWSELRTNLHGVLVQIVTGTARCHGDDTSALVNEVQHLIRERIITSLDEHPGIVG